MSDRMSGLAGVVTGATKGLGQNVHSSSMVNQDSLQCLSHIKEQIPLRLLLRNQMHIEEMSYFPEMKAFL